MNIEKSGRVTFVPLNRIKPKVVPFQENTDAILMVKKVTYEAKFKLAMQQVFARTIICPNLEVASSYVKSHGVNAITLDGDRIERKGAMTGGHHDPSRSRLDAVRNVALLQEAYGSESSRQEQIKQEIDSLDQNITAFAGERQQLESRSQRMLQSRKVIQQELDLLREEKASCQQRSYNLQLSQEQLTRELSTCLVKRNALQAELQTPLRRGLQSEGKAQLKSLTSIADRQEKQVAEMVAQINEMTNKKQMLEIELNGKLKRDREVIVTQLELMEEGSSFSQEMAELGGGNVQSIATRKKQLNQTKKQLTDRQKVLDRLEQQVIGLQADIEKLNVQKDQAERLVAEEARKIDKQDKTFNKISAKMREYSSRKEEAERKIRELGVVPGDANNNKFTGMTAEKIFKQLHTINAALKKFSNVNKRAVEHYDSFTKQRDQLLERQQDLEKSSESIEELIDTLDMRKDEAIDRTFKQVGKNFAEIFEKLVPMGKGKLIMQSKIDAVPDLNEGRDEEDDDEMQVDETNPKSIENYTGVSIRVSFNSKVDEGLRIQQLSGGQKSLVALAIVFAIQKCDPAPFYLFDEIDANLDAQYRTSVAAMIHELSNNAQFITTTFRPELVAVGEKHYGGEQEIKFSRRSVESLILT